MIQGFLRRAMLVWLAILASCDGSVPTEPEAEVPLRLVAGDYELVAAGATVSNTWTSESVRLEGIIRIEQDPITRSRLSGTFLDLRFVESGGLVSDWGLGGDIVGSIDANGSVLIELKTADGGFIWSGRGLVVDSQISGQWTVNGWAAGGFTARLRPIDGTGRANGAPPGFSHLEVRPAAVTLLPNEAIDIEVVPRDTKGNRTGFPAPVRYSSSAPEVAAVSTSGVVTAVREGTAEIVVDVSSNGMDRKAVVRVTVVSEIAYPDIDGVYDVDAPFTHFDIIWGDMTGYRYKAVITLKRDAQGPGLGGAFAGFALVDAVGQTEDCCASGAIRGTIARDGKITIGFVGAANSLTWELWGVSSGNAMEGTWFRGGHLEGTFRAVRR